MTFNPSELVEDPWLNPTHQERTDAITHGLCRAARTLSTTLRVLVGLAGRSCDRRDDPDALQLTCVLTLTQTPTSVAQGRIKTADDTTLNPQG